MSNNATQLTNPFRTDTAEVITGHVSGRRTDIREIIMGKQSAIILAGSPSIGKSALIRYLQKPAQPEWSWRNEVNDLSSQIKLDDIHFTLIDLTLLEEKQNAHELQEAFIHACFKALKKVSSRFAEVLEQDENLSSLRKVLRQIAHDRPHVRFFVMLDGIDRLGRNEAQKLIPQDEWLSLSHQDRGLAILDKSKAIRVCVDLIDEFEIFGVILAIKSLPRPKADYQFSKISTNLSYDLARFKTITLQSFTREDTESFLVQSPESFGAEWATSFQETGKPCIFEPAEQKWLLSQAGTSPYLLGHYCNQTFRAKSLTGTWSELEERDKQHIIERTNEQLSTFFVNVWNRLQEALEKSDKDTKDCFVKFVQLLEQALPTKETFDDTFWDELPTELRYILSSEGIVRFDLHKPIYHPGASLRQHLVQKLHENNDWIIPQVAPTNPGRGYWVTITRPNQNPEPMSLSELEYLLLKTLKQSPKRCKEEVLMQRAWGEPIPRPTFTQRMFHLRKRLREQCDGIEVIENHYGGSYSLNYPEWFQLE